MKNFNKLSKKELHDIQGGRAPTVSVILAPNVVKWILGFFK